MRQRQAAAVHELAGEGMIARELQRGIAQNAAGPALRRDEVRAARRIENVFVGGWDALGIVAVEQTIARVTVEHQRELPDQVVGVLNAAVGAACAERRDLMRGVAQKEDTTVTEALHALAAKGVNAYPLQGEVDLLAQHGPNARDDTLGPAFELGIGVPAELKIDTPDIVRLAMQQHRLVAVERRIEPE